MNVSTALWIALCVFLLALVWSARKAIVACRRENVSDWGGVVVNLLDGLNRLFCRRYHGLKHNPVPLPERGGAIVACNHVSGLDPLLMVAACHRPLRFLIAKEEYERWWLHPLYRVMGCIPVDRTRNAEKAFYRARQELAKGEVIAIFPQGGIHHAGEPRQPLKRGIIMLADLAKVPIFPMRVSGISGAGRVLGAVWRRSDARLEANSALTVNGPRDKETLHRLEAFLTGTNDAEH